MSTLVISSYPQPSESTIAPASHHTHTHQQHHRRPASHHHHHHHEEIEIPKLFQPREDAMPIIDPELKLYGRVWIPMTSVHWSAGVDRYVNGHPYPPSLCLLFQKGRCHAGERCNQIHVSQSFMAAVRTKLHNSKSSDCCFAHDNFASSRIDFRAFCKMLALEMVSEDGFVRVPIPSDQLAITTFWDKSLQQHTGSSSSAIRVQIHPSQICNLHQKSNCKYGVDCKRVHLCRQFWGEHSVKFTASAAAEQPEQPVTIARSPPMKPMTTTVMPVIQSLPPTHPQQQQQSSRSTSPAPMVIRVGNPMMMAQIQPIIVSAGPAAAATARISPPRGCTSANSSQGTTPCQSPRPVQMTQEPIIPMVAFVLPNHTASIMPTEMKRSPLNDPPNQYTKVHHNIATPSQAQHEASEEEISSRLMGYKKFQSQPQSEKGASPAPILKLNSSMIHDWLKGSNDNINDEVDEDEDCQNPFDEDDRDAAAYQLKCAREVYYRHSPMARTSLGTPTCNSRFPSVSAFCEKPANKTSSSASSSAVTSPNPVIAPVEKKPQSAPTEEVSSWMQKSQSTRGKYKGVSALPGVLPTVLTNGPSGKGFSAGRGKPIHSALVPEVAF